MLLATQTDVLGKKLGEEEAIRLICETGFDAIDYSIFHPADPQCSSFGSQWKTPILMLKAIGDSYGVPFTQAHAPFPSYRSGNDTYNGEIFQAIVRSLEISSLLGVKTVVVHPISLPNAEEQKAVNLDFYSRLLPYCRDLGVKIALENMWARSPEGTIIPAACGTGDSLLGFLELLPDDAFTACLDLGHCGIVGETASAMIRTLGRERLTALHVHDNDGLHDSHVFPYSGIMDWDGIAEALRDIGYTGNLTFEADNFFLRYDNALLPDVMRLLHSIGRHLINKIQGVS